MAKIDEQINNKFADVEMKLGAIVTAHVWISSLLMNIWQIIALRLECDSLQNFGGGFFFVFFFFFERSDFSFKFQFSGNFWINFADVEVKLGMNEYTIMSYR
jgi:hypothetical protein